MNNIILVFLLPYLSLSLSTNTLTEIEFLKSEEINTLTN